MFHNILGTNVWVTIDVIGHFVAALSRDVDMWPTMFPQRQTTDAFHPILIEATPSSSELADQILSGYFTCRAWTILHTVLVPVYMRSHYVVIRVHMVTRSLEMLDPYHAGDVDAHFRAAAPICTLLPRPCELLLLPGPLSLIPGL